METAEYADDINTIKEPLFKWLANIVLKNKDKIISRVKSHYWRTSHKFGIALSHYVEEAYAINEDNGNTFWGDYIEK